MLKKAKSEAKELPIFRKIRQRRFILEGDGLVIKDYDCRFDFF